MNLKFPFLRDAIFNISVSLKFFSNSLCYGK
jgi:hypothetical protein